MRKEIRTRKESEKFSSLRNKDIYFHMMLHIKPAYFLLKEEYQICRYHMKTVCFFAPSLRGYKVINRISLKY